MLVIMLVVLRLADGDARTTSNICKCKRRLWLLTSMEQTRVLAHARKLKNFNFFGASIAERMNLQHLYTLAQVLRVFLSKNRRLEFYL